MNYPELLLIIKIRITIIHILKLNIGFSHLLRVRPMMHTEKDIVARAFRILFMVELRLRGSEQGHDQRRSCKARQASRERK